MVWKSTALGMNLKTEMERIWNERTVAHPVYRACWVLWGGGKLESRPGKTFKIKRKKSNAKGSRIHNE
jgi:hypothetical protein